LTPERPDDKLDTVTPGRGALFISCGIFKEELRHLAAQGRFAGDVVFLDAALHVNFDKLRARLEQALREARESGAEPSVVYGHCHPDITEILERFGAKRLAAGNCLEAFVGAEEIERLNAEATSFFLSAGWVNNWEKMFEMGRVDFDFDFKSMFESYRRIVVFDTGIIPLDEEKIQKFSAFTGLPVERKTMTLDYFLGLVTSI
jgi:hypothetical protein